MIRYDAVVIGSGQAGNPLSQKLADQGWTVALIEKEHLGGTCVNTGCTPTKTMVASAQVAHYARHADVWGVQTGAVRVDLPSVVARKDRIVNQWRSGVEKKIADRKNLHLYRGAARFTAPHRIRVNQEEIESERIFINTGTRPAIPSLEGLDRIDYLTNASILELRELPAHLLVIGGGYIGLEFSQMFRRFGSDVTIVHRDDHVLPREDSDVTVELQKALEKEGIRFLLRARPTRVERQNGQIVLKVETAGGSETVRGSHLLVATGRRPNTDDLGLESTGVQLTPEGFVKVNGRLETNVPGIWALGDVKGGPAFTHISYNDYQIVYSNLIDGQNLTTDHRLVPYAVFTDPQLGRVGLTEKEARAAGHKLKVGKIPTAWVARAIERDETAGLMKVVVDGATDKILGAAILSSEGGELVQILEFVMLAGASYKLLKGAVYIHPTLAEGFWTLMEEVKLVDQDPSEGRRRTRGQAMHELKKLDIATMWKGLEWASGRLVLRRRMGEKPLEAEHAPTKPGLYRMTWDGVDDWKGLAAHITVLASRKIADPRLNIQQLQPPVLLTIGRTTDIYGRIREHLGTNENNNRLFMRLKRMLPHLVDEGIRQAAVRTLLVEWVAVPNWSHRCLLERYGSVVCTPLFDLDAEH